MRPIPGTGVLAGQVELDRRQLLATGAACLAWGGAPAGGPRGPGALDALLAAHAAAVPERAGAGANHYPMAAEALEALGRDDAIDDTWVEGASLYAGEPARAGALDDDAGLAGALGRYDRLGDWLDRFRAELQREPWRAVVARWAPRLAPGICGAAFHGVIRTGHAARALRVRESDARRDELAVGLAYWAARYTELPTTGDEHRAGESLLEALQGLEHPWLDETAPVDFFSVVPRLTETPLAPPVRLADGSDPRAELDALVRDATCAFLEMLVQERHRIWLLHTVTGPAAVGLLLPEVDPAGARELVAYARQAVVAMHAAYGAPFTPRAHVRDAPAPWPDLIGRAVATRSVHTIKLVEALVRFERDDDSLARSVALQWLAWK